MTGVVCAIDPGKMTGVALWNAGEVTAEERTPVEAVSIVEELARHYRQNLVVAYETYVFLDSTKTRQYDATEVIGCLKYLAWRESFRLVAQTPAEAKNLGTTARLKALGWWDARAGESDDDQTSALRHLLLCRVKTLHDHDLVRGA